MVEDLVDAMANLREEQRLKIVRGMVEGSEDPLEVLELSRSRPHQALDYLTPLDFLERWKGNKRKQVMCH